MICLFWCLLIDIDDCRTLEFKPSIVGHSLFYHVIETRLAVSQDNCELKCYMEDECISINFGPGDGGAYLCELSDSDHNVHPQDLQQRDGFIYRPTRVRFKTAWVTHSNNNDSAEKCENTNVCASFKHLFRWFKVGVNMKLNEILRGLKRG